MARVIFFNLIQLVASVYALVRGGGPERVVGGALLAAAVATRMLAQGAPQRFGALESGVLIVDVLLLAVLLAVALLADRWWPMWVASLHLLGTVAHLVKAIEPGIERFAYATLAAAWSYPIVALLVIGTWRHERRCRGGSTELDWSSRSSR